MPGIGKKGSGESFRRARDQKTSVPDWTKTTLKTGEVSPEILAKLEVELKSIVQEEGESDQEFEKRKSLLKINIEFCKVQLASTSNQPQVPSGGESLRARGAYIQGLINKRPK